MVVTTSTPSQTEITKSGRVKAEFQKEIVVTDTNARTGDQHIPDVGDQSETNDHKGFPDMGFMPQATVSGVPLNVVYTDSYFEGKIHQGTNNNIDSDDDQLNPCKMKASFSWGTHVTKTGSFAAIDDPLTLPPSKKSKLTVD